MRDFVAHWCMEVPGHCDYYSLYADAVNRISMGSVATMVEVGVWKGHSLAFLAVQAHNSDKNIEVYGVDAFEDSDDTHMSDNPANGAFWTKEQVLEPFAAHGVNVQLIKGVSWEAASQFEDASVDFCFIDAAHDYLAASKDIAAWWPKVKPGGVFAGHDYDFANYPGVVAAVHEKFGPVRRIHRSWFVPKP